MGLPSVVLNQTTPIGTAIESFTNAIGGCSASRASPGQHRQQRRDGVGDPPKSNGVTGLKTGTSILTIPSGNGYDAPADWYFPTQADGSVQAQRRHLAAARLPSDLGRLLLRPGGRPLAQETNSIVVVPQINWFNDASPARPP